MARLSISFWISLGGGVTDRLFDFRFLGERDLGLHLAGVRVEDVAEAAGSPLHLFAADEMTDLTHGVFLRFKGVLGLQDGLSRRFVRVLQLSAARSRPAGLFRLHQRLAFTGP